MGLRAEEVGVPHTEQTHKHRNVLLQRRGSEVLIHGVEALEETHEVHRPDGAHQRQADGGIDGVAPAHPVPETEHVLGIDAELGDLLRVGGDRNEVLGDGRLITIKLLNQPSASSMSIGQGFLGGEGLGGDDEEGGAGVEAVESRGEVRRVNVGDELRANTRYLVGTQCLGSHGGAQVRAADADVDDLLDGVARMSQPRAGAQCGGEVAHAAENLMDISSDVLAINAQVLLYGQAQCGVQDSAILGVVEVFAGEHGVAAALDVRSAGKVHELGHDVLIDEVLRQIHMQARGVEGVVRGAGRRVGEELAQIEVLLLLKKRGERGPLWLCGDVHCKSLSGR